MSDNFVPLRKPKPKQATGTADPALTGEVYQLPHGREVRRLEPGEIIHPGDLYGFDITKLVEYTQSDKETWGTVLSHQDPKMQPFYRSTLSTRGKTFIDADTKIEGMCIMCEKKAVVDIMSICQLCAHQTVAALPDMPDMPEPPPLESLDHLPPSKPVNNVTNLPVNPKAAPRPKPPSKPPLRPAMPVPSRDIAPAPASASHSAPAATIAPVASTKEAPTAPSVAFDKRTSLLVKIIIFLIIFTVVPPVIGYGLAVYLHFTMTQGYLIGFGTVLVAFGLSQTVLRWR